MLAQLATVKARLAIATVDTGDDTLLTNFIELVTGRFNRECNRVFARSAAATFEFCADVMEVIPDRLPIESVASFHLKSNETDGWVAQSDVDFLIRRGAVLTLHTRLGSASEQARVTYAGGYVLPGTNPSAGQTALPDEVEHACVEQVAHLYQSRDRLGLSSVQGQGGQIQSFAQIDLLTGVKAVLKKYERWNC